MKAGELERAAQLIASNPGGAAEMLALSAELVLTWAAIRIGATAETEEHCSQLYVQWFETAIRVGLAPRHIIDQVEAAHPRLRKH